MDGMVDGGGEESNVRDFPAPIYIYIIFKSRITILNVVIFLLSHIISYFTIYRGWFIYKQNLVIKLVITEGYNFTQYH